MKTCMFVYVYLLLYTIGFYVGLFYFFVMYFMT